MIHFKDGGNVTVIKNISASFKGMSPSYGLNSMIESDLETWMAGSGIKGPLLIQNGGECVFPEKSYQYIPTKEKRTTTNLLV